MWPVHLVAWVFMRLKFIGCDHGSFRVVCCHFYLSAAVIAPNTFWRCIIMRRYGKWSGFSGRVILTTRTLCK